MGQDPRDSCPFPIPVYYLVLTLFFHVTQLRVAPVALSGSHPQGLQETECNASCRKADPVPSSTHNGRIEND